MPATPFTVDYPRSQDDLQRSLQRAYERLNALQSQLPTKQAAIESITITTTQTAGATYTATEQAMLNALKADVISLATTVNQIITTLAAYGTTKSAP